MKKIGVLVALLLLLSGGACRKTDFKKVEISVPGMKNEACVQLITDAIRKQPGVISVETDLEAGKVTVTYNSMLVARKNLEFAVAGAGFNADETPAFTSAVANLPPSCR